ncbi:acyl-CoA dehydrogenase family protein [Streptomyces sp. NPDC021100]|uniref:acyl-CoA dehydrogenase family protein n=1 Tax=Streptomyces sp. NPDC021100 TaxID=3365114 RepID=UPI0037947E68
MSSPDVTAAADLAAAHAEKADRDGRLDTDVVQALTDSGLPRHFTPRLWGGTQGTFTTALAAITELAWADPSAGWCAALATSMSRVAAFLPPDGQHALWSTSPDQLIAGTLQPAGHTTTVKGGWTLTGTWPFVTGADHAHWALLCTTTGSRQRLLLVPATAWTLTPTWDTPGLRATASHTLTVEHYFVPTSHGLCRRRLLAGDHASLTATCYNLPHEAISALFFAAPLLGAAQALLAETEDHARRTGQADGPILATAAGQIDAADLLLARAADLADQPAPPSDRQVIRSRRDYAFAASLLAEAGTRLFHHAGVRAASTGGRLPRFWRDLTTAALHPALRMHQPAHAYTEHLLTPHDKALPHP